MRQSSFKLVDASRGRLQALMVCAGSVSLRTSVSLESERATRGREGR